MANKASKKSKKPKNIQPPPPIDPPSHEQPPETIQLPPDTPPLGLSETDFPMLPHSPVENNPLGGALATAPLGDRKNRGDDNNPVSNAPDATNGLVPDDGMGLPGKTTVPAGKEEKNSLQIKIHLNLHAKVRLDLDAKLYGDVVIGLL
ncbi:hypothetical protein PENANT_c029G04075 [Penicillium antarcticum]|uniref:Uncharacterized protein n=1 Tax=Penicillium antarcticum TaxID=416450 RepID=A0A1V6PW03_9EURO|nr:uncharacterized protein N7508_001648 [Penicillium antarcticum]KAJ5317140.1 hypothetical protein N7508_001648 [Penicillium antarcticum]OQD81145.1 hypothetical protein PENANT_c029G04075 [Penicillium antarcticum]